MNMQVKLIGLLAIIAARSVADEAVVMVQPEDIVWAHPGSGNPTEFYTQWSKPDGSHGRWTRFPPGFTSPVHRHTHDYHGVVIQGVLSHPSGPNSVDVELGPGAYWVIPGNEVHRSKCVSEIPCVFYIHQLKPFDFHPTEWDK